MWNCANGYPRDNVCQLSDQSIAQDAMRKEFWRCHLCRYFALINSHMPVVSFINKANTDGHPIVTIHQAGMYLCKYCTKEKEQLGTRLTLFDVLADMEPKNKAVASKTCDSEWQATMSNDAQGIYGRDRRRDVLCGGFAPRKQKL